MHYYEADENRGDFESQTSCVSLSVLLLQERLLEIAIEEFAFIRS
jgi:hypothetical protein